MQAVVGGASEKSAFLRHADKCWTCSNSPHGPCEVGWKIINDTNNMLTVSPDAKRGANTSGGTGSP